ncbi:hypothetical protein F4825DRAFT_451890 [Nemania diffusa]|nr:hypothetical protein F4825DRAFT_451890 [Nemania diffusa]
MDNTMNPPSIPDYYLDLGVSQTANLKTIRKAFSTLALATHPDKNVGSPDNAASFRKVREAWEFLSDPKKRAGYDLIYFDVQDAWERYRRRQEERSRRERAREAEERAEAQRRAAEEQWRAAEAERRRKIEAQRRAAEEAARREKMREEKARQAEARSREAARRAWEEQQRAAEERIRREKEAAAEARSREVAERLRAEQEEAALERLKMAKIQEKQDAVRHAWAGLRQAGENPSAGATSSRPPSAASPGCSHPEFGWPKRKGQARLENDIFLLNGVSI